MPSHFCFNIIINIANCNNMKSMKQHKPGNRKIKRYTKRQRKIMYVGEFAQYGSYVTFEYQPIDDFDDKVDIIFDILDQYQLDSVISWDENEIKTQTTIVIPLFEYHGAMLGKAFVELVANKINDALFHGTIKQIDMNRDAVWDD